MASLCTRCLLRSSRRAYSTAPSFAKPLPVFTPTSSPELDTLLSTIRSKHIIPHVLHKAERKLIFGIKNREYLEESPQTTTIGGEEIQLEWIDQRTEIPNRRKLMKRVLQLMKEGEPQDWENLPKLLLGLTRAKKTPSPRQLAKMVRLATNAGRFGIVMRCLQRPIATGMSMEKEEVLRAVMWALREVGRGERGGWEQEGVGKALRDANEIASLLESEGHGSGTYVKKNDPRTRPEVLAIFLELAAVQAWKFQDGMDTDGRVRAFAERLLSNVERAAKVSQISCSQA
jgi:hypothetical protein